MDTNSGAAGYDSNILESLLHTNKKLTPKKVASSTLGNTGEDFAKMSSEGLCVLSQNQATISRNLAEANS
jgi:hypothetical protein